jgi:predicted nucleotidyltransferase
MRLLPEQIEHVVTASRELLGADARVWLFGSRVRDDVRGGDIDLPVEADRQVGQLVMPAAASGWLER